MTRLAIGLRIASMLAVAGAIADPGCPRPPRVAIDVAFAGELPSAVRARERARIAAAAPWAHVRDEGPGGGQDASGATTVARVLVGDPGPALTALRRRRADLAWQPGDPALVVERVWAPTRIMAGTAGVVTVGLHGHFVSGRPVDVVLTDVDSGLEQGRSRVPAATWQSRTQVHVPWLATGLGRRRLRVHAEAEGQQQRPAAPAEVTIDVLPAGAEVAVLEARPTWAMRFARLALIDATGVHVRTEVRLAPGLAVRTDASRQAGAQGASETHVHLVSGVEALTSADVGRLERNVRERGHAVVLLLDDAPGAGPWRRLWPERTGPARAAPRPMSGSIAGHRWRMREWLQPPLSMAVVPLAYFASERPGADGAFVLGRALGAGRIVLVTALDAWRYRADQDVAFAAGWRALVQRLAADVPPPVAAVAWIAGDGQDTRLEVEVTLRPDVAAAGPTAVSADVGARPGVPLVLAHVESDRWRGAMRVPAGSTPRVRIEARARGRVVGRAEMPVHGVAAIPAAAWEDVTDLQEERGQLATGNGDAAGLLARMRDTRPVLEQERWYLSRTWPYAAVVLSLLGAEWILRRLLGQR